MRHEPVLLKEVVELVRPADPAGVIVDATVGLGGHSEALLDRWPDAELIGIDRDPMALEASADRLGRFGDRVRLIEGRHELLIEILKSAGVKRVDALVADLGVSSMQFDTAERGFSFRHDAPLDMRMGREGRTAADLVNELPEQELAGILRKYGEEPKARAIAAAIVRARRSEPITTTTELAAIIREVSRPRRDRIDPSTLTFQALRIAVNEEIEGLAGFVRDGVEVLAVGGRIGIISFHSLEDRVVKQTLRELTGECRCPPRLPECVCDPVERVSLVERKAIKASAEEVDRNPRSRSARLRVAERLQIEEA